MDNEFFFKYPEKDPGIIKQKTIKFYRMNSNKDNNNKDNNNKDNNNKDYNDKAYNNKEYINNDYNNKDYNNKAYNNKDNNKNYNNKDYNKKIIIINLMRMKRVISITIKIINTQLILEKILNYILIKII